MLKRTITTTIEEKPENFINYKSTPVKRWRKNGSVKEYKLSLISGKREYDIWNRFEQQNQADIKGEEIMRCFSEKAYPCNIKILGD